MLGGAYARCLIVTYQVSTQPNALWHFRALPGGMGWDMGEGFRKGQTYVCTCG